MLGAKFCAKESGLARNRILLERAALCPWVVRNLAARAYVRLCINPKDILWAKSVQAGVKQVYTRVVLGENPWGERRPYAAVPARESQLGWPTQKSVEVGEHPCWLHLCTWFTDGTRISAEMFSFIQSCRRRRIRIKKHLYLDFEPVITQYKVPVIILIFSKSIFYCIKIVPVLVSYFVEVGSGSVNYFIRNTGFIGGKQS